MAVWMVMLLCMVTLYQEELVPPRLFTLGYIISGVDSWIGSSMFPRPLIAAGMMKKKIMTIACTGYHYHVSISLRTVLHIVLPLPHLLQLVV